MKNTKIKVDMKGSYKCGVDEIVGLKQAIKDAFTPIVQAVQRNVYWIDSVKDQCVDALEYKSRDGFIPHSHNCGGLELSIVLPKCEEYDWSAVEFGECDGCNADCSKCMRDEADSSGECMSEVDGHLDARLRVILKFEGIDEVDGSLRFYINACGGNGDAPYFRIGHLSDLYEAEFSCKSVKGVKRAASKHIKAMLKALGLEHK